MAKRVLSFQRMYIDGGTEPTYSHARSREYWKVSTFHVRWAGHSRHFNPYRTNGHMTFNEFHSIEICAVPGMVQGYSHSCYSPCGSANTNEPTSGQHVVYS